MYEHQRTVRAELLLTHAYEHTLDDWSSIQRYNTHDLTSAAAELRAFERTGTLSDASHERLSFVLAADLYNKGDYHAALDQLANVIRLDPKNGAAHNARGKVLHSLGRDLEAVEAYDHAINLSPRSPAAYYNRAVVLAQLGKTMEALGSIGGALQLEPHASTFLALRAGLLLNAGDPTQALKEARNIIAQSKASLENPHGASIEALAFAYHVEGVALLQQGAEIEAAKAFDHAISLNPRSADAHYYRALALTMWGAPEEGLKSADHALQLQPDSATFYTGRAWILRSLGRLDEALDDVDRAVALDPKNSAAHVERGSVLGAMKCTEEAVGEFTKAIELDARSPDAHRDFAAFLYGIERYEDAAREYATASTLQPTNYRLYVGRALALQQLGQLDQAIASVEEAIGLAKGDVGTELLYGDLLLASGNLNAAVRSYEYATQAFPASTEAYTKLGEALARARAIDPSTATAVKGTLHLCRLSDFNDLDLKNGEKSVGKVDGIILDAANGRLAFAVIGNVREFGPGKQQHLIPWESITVTPSDSARNQGAVARTRLTAEEIDAAPVYGKNEPFDGPMVRRIRENAKLPSDSTWERIDTTHLVASSDLNGSTVRSPEDKHLGEIDDIVLAPDERMVAYVVLGMGGMLGLGETQYALPLSIFEITYDKDHKLVVHALRTKESFVGAPEYNSRKWGSMSDAAWVRKMSMFWNKDPYWTHTTPR